MSNSKAFVCFCVDGQSDIDALRIQFEDLFDEVGGNDINVDFRFSEFQGENHGDITTLKGVEPDNIEQSIHKYYFKQQDKNANLGWNDLTSIIHIIDLDGAYAKDSQIQEFSREELDLADKLSTHGQTKKVLYFDDHISVRADAEPGKVPPIELMCNRNKRKRRNIEYLVQLDELTAKKKTVQYSLYYFSSNMDYFLYGDPNMTGADKMRNASCFSRENGDGNALLNYFRNNEYCTKEEYVSSWNSLRKGNNSLIRGTNVNLLVERIKGSKITDWL